MRPPQFWGNPRHAPGALAGLLRPLSRIWRWQTTRRWSKGRHAKMSVPVICVGNINIGGSGKTPTVVALVAQLQSLGKTPHILSRGYGGRLSGPVAVDPERHTANDVGDEAILLSAFAPTWVSRDRVAGALAAISAGADILVMDDGMQNPDLIKDLTVLVVDAAVGFGNGCVIPAGPLRQPVAQGLARADLVLTLGTAEACEKFLQIWPETGARTVTRGTVRPLETGMDWHGVKVLAFAGIGRPEKFYQSLRDVGADVVQTRSFDDHQVLSDPLFKRLEAEAWDKGLQLVTTEKDAARLPQKYQQSVLTLPVRLHFEVAATIESVLRQII